MNEAIWIWKYCLKSASTLNASSQRKEHPGALIRIGSGYGCIHPWPELGDLPLEQQLESISDGRTTRLAEISINCAKLDGEARSAGVNLFDRIDAPIPESHWLYQDGDDIHRIREKGFSTVKLKIGPSFSNTELLKSIADQTLIIRLDANCTFRFGEFLEWWQSLTESVQSQIEFVEDPVPWNWWNWYCLEQSGVPLAVDRDSEKSGRNAAWSIFKPAVNLKPNLRKKLAVTSYMDHPLGQMWAALKAQELNEDEPDFLGECGLLTHRCFEKCEFSERIEVSGSVLQPPRGTGLGFDGLLEKLPWQKLT